MFIPFELFAPVPCHFADNRVRHAFNEKHGRSEMTKIVNPQISDSSRIAYPSKPLSNIPSMWFLKLLYVAIFNVRTGRKKIIVIALRRKLF